MNNPLVSIIIPCYNVENYVKECLDSVINQTYRNLEIICVNDGSTDSTLEILRTYKAKESKDARIILLDQENKGQSVARNVGIDAATGDYIVFVDSDDWIDSNFVLNLVRTAIHTNADIVAGNVVQVYDDCVKIPVITYDKTVTTNDSFEKYKLAKVPEYCYPCNKLYKRESLLHSKTRFKENVIFEDIIFLNKIVYYMKRLSTTADATYYYRCRYLSSMNGRSDKWITDFNQAQKEALRFRQSINPDIEDITKFDWTEIDKYKLFNIVLLTVKTYGLSKLYYLFGKLLIFQKDVKRRT